MSGPDLPEITESGLRCPVCRAQQEWADTCRRCRCDLALVRAAADAYFASRRRCLALLGAAQFPQALAEARRAWELHPASDAQRLLAVCTALCGEWAEAAGLVRLV
jgi:hypothetical protein